MKKVKFLFTLMVILLLNCQQTQPKPEYQPTWESLSKHRVPEWYSDANFGIFIHWGVYAVPAWHEWYVVFMSPKSSFGRNMGGPPYTAAQGEMSDSLFQANIREEANEYHRETFGEDFAYDDFIPMFKAENFRPEEWANLFRESGARYVVMTAKHGDEFAMWPTQFTDRNAMDMGPHRDLVGELTRAVRDRGMKMGYYHNTTYSFWDARYPEKEWVDYMNNSIKELVDLYQPDILWGDVVIGPVRNENGKPLGAEHWNSKELIAYYYNRSFQVLTNDRWGLDMTRQVNSKKALSQSVWSDLAKRLGPGIEGALLGDFQTPERRNVNDIFDFPWETCNSLDPTSWGYNKFLPEEDYMTTDELVDHLVDIVSKNGNLLINIAPRADGTIPEVMQDRLRGIGEWLSVNGEAIYGTTHWKTFGEGSVRFTRKGDVLYAIALEWPGEHLTLTAAENLQVHDVSMPGLTGEIEWEMTPAGLVIQLPESLPSTYANVLRIETEAL